MKYKNGRFLTWAPASAYLWQRRRTGKQIAVLGVSAGVGRLVVEQGLGQGHRLVDLACLLSSILPRCPCQGA